MKNHTDGDESERLPGSDSQVPILCAESELKDRIREIIDGEAVAAFARRCGITESLVRKYLSGSQPSVENLVLLASTAGVSVEWLATGRGIRRAADMRKAEKALQDGDFRVIDGEARPLTAASKPSPTSSPASIPPGSMPPSSTSFSRAQNAAEMHALKQAVAELRAAQNKTA